MTSLESTVLLARHQSPKSTLSRFSLGICVGLDLLTFHDAMMGICVMHIRLFRLPIYIVMNFIIDIDMDRESPEREVITRLPGGWRKIRRIRQSGQTIGRPDLYVVTPEGTRLRSCVELCNYISALNYFDSIDPLVVNFEIPRDDGSTVPSKQRKEFIEFVQTKGAYLPSFLARKQKEPPVKMRIKMSENSLRRCKKCSFVSYNATDFVRQPENGSDLCQECLCPDPYETLNRYFLLHRALPQNYELNRLKIQTGLEEKAITEFYFEHYNPLRNHEDPKEDALTKNNSIRAKECDEESEMTQPESFTKIPDKKRKASPSPNKESNENEPPSKLKSTTTIHEFEIESLKNEPVDPESQSENEGKSSIVEDEIPDLDVTEDEIPDLDATEDEIPDLDTPDDESKVPALDASNEHSPGNNNKKERESLFSDDDFDGIPDLSP